MISRHVLLLASLLLVSFPRAMANVIISDYRIGNRDVTPVLGRGFSLATGNFQSTCLIFEGIPDPTYDLDYYFYGVESRSGFTEVTNSKISSSLNFGIVKQKMEMEYQRDVARQSTSHFMFVVLRADRYYETVDEGHSTLSKSASSILQNRDYVGFFQACGPAYIRSMRRSAELTAIFTYHSDSASLSAQFSLALEAELFGQSEASSESSSLSHSQFSSSLSAEVFTYGFKAEMSRAGNFVMREPADFKSMISYACSSLQDVDVGLVVSVEVVPWVNNLQFQQASGMLKSMVMEICTDASGREVTCDSETEQTVTRRKFGGLMRKYFMITNSEHIVKVDEYYRTSLEKILFTRKCGNALQLMPISFDNLELRSQQCPMDCSGRKTVKQLRDALNERADNGSYLFGREMLRARDVFTNYVAPCLEALTEMVHDVENGKMQTVHWQSLEECGAFMCTLPGVLWERNTCVLRSMSSDAQVVADSVVMGIADEFCMPILK